MFKKNFLTLAMSSFLALSIISAPAYASEANPPVSEDLNDVTSMDNLKLINPYIEQYRNEQNVTNLLNSNRDYLVNPAEEGHIIEATLETYYKKDQQVAQILETISGDQSIREKTLSLVKEDKIDIMHEIEKYYQNLPTSDQEVLVGYLDRYAVSSEDGQAQTFLKQITESKSEISLAAAYNGTAAGDWAYNNYNKYNTNFPAFNAGWGSDCTNFVSQAMHLGGGKAMEGKWYVYKKNSTYLSPKSASELNYSWTLADPSPWISVQEFRDYWKPKSTVHSYSRKNYQDNHSTIYNSTIYKGDVVVFHKGVAGWITTPTHLMIISAYDTSNKDFKLAPF